MKDSWKKGFSFGLTSAIITTLGMMVGLHSSTHSKMAVIGGIIAIAVADAFSDALGIHISEESENKHSQKEIWESTIATFITKLLFAMTFAVPVLLIEGLELAIIASVVYGLALLVVFSIYIGREGGQKTHHVVLEHLAIAISVVIITHYVGDWIGVTFPMA
jgi:VIT1/CCC1 family predicted Fe2+/Mn2+ transporter